MKIRIWTALTDGGDGEHHSTNHKSKDAMIEDLQLKAIEQWGNDGFAFDKWDYPVNFSVRIFDTDGYEVVE